MTLAAQSDVRSTMLYAEARDFYRDTLQPGSGAVVDAGEPHVHVSASSETLAFSATQFDDLDGGNVERIGEIDLKSGDLRILTFGPNTDRSPRYAPDGMSIAFLSDRAAKGDFQLYIFDRATGLTRSTAPVDGWVEYQRWSPDGSRILLGVAGHGADIAGGQGAVTSTTINGGLPDWSPELEASHCEHEWRSIWCLDIASGAVQRVSPAGITVWEASWCGSGEIAFIGSPDPSEGAWYTAKVYLLDPATSQFRCAYSPSDQLGLVTASPSGRFVTFIEAVCSDRWLVAGTVILVDTETDTVLKLNEVGFDATYLEWMSDDCLLIGGHCGFDTKAGIYSVSRGDFSEKWSSSEVATGGFYFAAAGLNARGDFALLAQGFTRSPEAATVREGVYRTVRPLAPVGSIDLSALLAVEQLTWKAPGGLDIEGWFLRPMAAAAPYPVIMYAHGGPVWHYQPFWIGRRSAGVAMLLRRGCAIFFPNPRGSSGRGQDFARLVVGDMGGADTADYLAGLDYLVDTGLADARRVGVTGGSYGGFMTNWLITQDQRFAAALPVAPVTNFVTEHLVSNIPHFVQLFLDDDLTNLAGRYYSRSPLLFADRVKCPTFSICGALDRCTPAVEAIQFHRAIKSHGVDAVLATYPKEGHGVRTFPAALDFAARFVSWFGTHLGVNNLE